MQQVFIINFFLHFQNSDHVLTMIMPITCVCISCMSRSSCKYGCMVVDFFTSVFISVKHFEQIVGKLLHFKHQTHFKEILLERAGEAVHLVQIFVLWMTTIMYGFRKKKIGKLIMT